MRTAPEKAMITSAAVDAWASCLTRCGGTVDSQALLAVRCSAKYIPQHWLVTSATSKMLTGTLISCVTVTRQIKRPQYGYYKRTCAELKPSAS
jgi:hypothetical protein